MIPAGHRNLFNADANSWFYRYRPQSAFYRPYGQPLTAADIQAYVDVLADAGVDTLLMNAADKLAYYPSKAVPTILDGYRRDDRAFFYGHILGWEMTARQIEAYLADAVHLQNGYLDLVEAGIDWLAEVAAACRRRGISPWVSIRMNDMHGATRYIPGSYMNCALYKDPAMRLRGTSFNPEAPPSNTWQGFNYAQLAVRDYMMAILRDVVENYDFEGLELDWMRWPLCCEPNPAQETIDTVTAWHAGVRRLTERQAAKTGKPYPLGVKYGGTLDQMRGIGLDLRAMARAGVIDFVSPSNSWQTSWDIPLDALREEFGPRVAVFGVIELAPNWLHGFLPHQPQPNAGLGSAQAIDYRLTPACPPILYGNAAAKLVLGADAIEVYNYPPADQPSHWPWENDEDACSANYPALARIDDLDFLRGKPKLYTLASRNGYYIHELFETTGPFPGVLGPSQRQECRIPMCAETDGERLELVVQVVVKRQEQLPPVGVYFNGSWPNFAATPDDRLLFPVATMTHHLPDNLGLDFAFPLGALREGWNDIGIMNGAAKRWGIDQAAETVAIESLEIAVRERAG